MSTTLRVLAVIAAASLAVAACGRTTPLSSGDGGVVRDGLTIWPEVRPPWFDGSWPPPPLFDVRPPPRLDVKAPKADVPLPPKLDIWPPKPDILPPPKDGPCAGSCSQICQLIVPCGLTSGGYNNCLNSCGAWSPTLASCLKKVVCSSQPSCAVASTCFVTPPPPPPLGADLAITSMTANVTGGSTPNVIYQLQVCNKGSSASTMTTPLYVYYNLPGAPSVGQPGDAYNTVPPLQAGACVNRNIIRYSVPPGTYSSWARVDPLGQIAEANEANNTFGPLKVSVGTTAGADLTIKSFTAAKSGTSTVSYQVQVCNAGTGTAGASQLHVYWNRSTAPAQGTMGDQAATVPQLQPGACSTQTVSRTATPPGTYTSWAQADPQNLIAETNESNNVAGPVTVTVTPPQQQPNLAFASFDAKGVGQSEIDYSLVVCNTGQAAAGSFRVDLYYNRATPPTINTAGNQFTTVASLSAGACTSINFVAKPLAPGLYVSWAQADTNNTVAESSEQNNVAGPRAVTLGAVVDCNAICAFAATCGLFTPTQLPQCVSWCNALSTTAKQCAVNATQQASCANLKACAPPPPPPPNVCPGICTYLTTPCNLLPANQYWTCIGACQSLTPVQIQCAQDAKAKGQCMQIVQCIF